MSQTAITQTGRKDDDGQGEASADASLDGLIESPAWTGPFWNDELSQLQKD